MGPNGQLHVTGKSELQLRVITLLNYGTAIDDASNGGERHALDASTVCTGGYSCWYTGCSRIVATLTCSDQPSSYISRAWQRSSRTLTSTRTASAADETTTVSIRVAERRLCTRPLQLQRAADRRQAALRHAEARHVQLWAVNAHEWPSWPAVVGLLSLHSIR